MITQQRRKPGPSPKSGPKAAPAQMSLYPKDLAAIRWWSETRSTDSNAAALRQMIDIAMSLTLGSDWADQLESDAA